MKSKAILILAALVMVLAVCPGPALAAESAKPEETPEILAPEPPAAVYPAEIRAYEENGTAYLEKVYYLSPADDPSAIPTDDLERDGRVYVLLDILKSDQRETDKKDYVETKTFNSETKDVSEIIKTLDEELEVVTEEGYIGVLKPDYPSITVEAAGYKTCTWTVSATRTYPSLSGADLSLIPKTIQDSGRTLTLADVDWQAASETEAATTYTAVATYTGTASGRYATGYTVTVDYKGEVSRTSLDAVIYTAVFASHGETQIEPSAPIATEEPVDNPDDNDTPRFDARLLLIPGAVVLLAAAGFGVWRGTKYYHDKKRGYVK